jgi:hypothetical protein
MRPLEKRSAVYWLPDFLRPSPLSSCQRQISMPIASEVPLQCLCQEEKQTLKHQDCICLSPRCWEGDTWRASALQITGGFYPFRVNPAHATLQSLGIRCTWVLINAGDSLVLRKLSLLLEFELARKMYCLLHHNKCHECKLRYSSQK